MQGSQEFKNEVELLSRVHHKNLVKLVGFCFDKGEQTLLVYEFIPNGTLMESLSGKSGIQMDWMRRLMVTLGSARVLQYLLELADPPIIHRDIKSSNILLDERLTSKVADFGLSKLQDGKYIVREIKETLNRTKDLYDLHRVIEPLLLTYTTMLVGLEKFVDLALECVQDEGTNRPTMREVVKEIENIVKLAGMNPNAESAPSSHTYDGVSGGSFGYYYSDNSLFHYSGSIPLTRAE